MRGATEYPKVQNPPTTKNIMADENTTPEVPQVDETPISGVRSTQGRKNSVSLEQHLQHRPERSELVAST